MKKPVLDSFDRWVINSDTYLGRSVRRKYKLIKFKRKYSKYVRKH